MKGYKRRVDEMIAKHGEDLTINGVTSTKGFFMLTDLTRLNTYFNSYEQSNMNKPVLTLQLPADALIAPDDSIERDGRTYGVQRLARFRVEGEIVMQTVILT